MSSQGSPFRQATGSCALCGKETPAEELESLAGLEACSICRSGDLDEAIRVQGLREDTLIIDAKKGSPSDKDDGFQIMLTFSTPLEIDAVLRAEAPINWFTKLFRKPDPEIGYEEFDRAVHVSVDEASRPPLEGILASPGAREAVMRLVGMRCKVVLFNSTVDAVVREWDIRNVPPIEEARKHIVALAMYVQEYATKQG